MKRAALVLLAGGVAAPAHAQEAAPDAAQQCVRAYESAQELKLDKKLVEARHELRACMADVCPTVARQSCAGWLDEVEQAMPSVVLRFFDGEVEQNDVRVSVDGRPLVDRLDGAAIEVNPGPHTFRFEPAGGAPIEQSVTIAEGEKLRQVVATIAPPPAPPPPVPPPPPDTSVHPMAWVLYGLSAAGVGAFIGLGVHSLSLEDCEPTCTDDDVDDIVLFRALADVSLGVGALALGGAIWITIASLDSDVEVGVLAAPTAAGVRLRF